MDLKLTEGYEISELKESAKKILTATEKDFNEMKDQTWYKRIWGIVTFSQKNKKITANNISNLSQAQQLMYKIIVNLSEKNVEVFSIMEDLQDQIFRLTKNNVAFAKKVQLRLYGFKENKSLDTFNENDIRVVISTILSLSELYTPSSNEQKEYLNNLRCYLGSPEISNDFDIDCLSDYMESIKKQKTLLQIVLEYIYLYDLNFEINDKVEDFLDNFDVRYQKIVKNISNKINAFGHDVVINRFFAEDEEEFDEIYFEEADTVEISNLEELIIDNKYMVRKGKQNFIESKKLIVRNNFFIKGQLQIKNCEIHLEENFSKNVFFLDEEAKLSILNSKVFNTEDNQETVVYANEYARVEFSDSSFENCHNIIISDENKDLEKIVFKNSTFNNCSNIIKIEDIGEIEVGDCTFSNCKNAICIEDVSSTTDKTTGIFKITNCEVKNNKNFFLKVKRTEEPLIIEDCIFKGWQFDDYLLESIQNNDIKIIIDMDAMLEIFPEEFEIKILSRNETLDSEGLDEYLKKYEDYDGELYELSLIQCDDLEITTCDFDGIDEEKLKFKVLNSNELLIENTKFKNCEAIKDLDSEIISALCTLFDNKLRKKAEKNYIEGCREEFFEKNPDGEFPKLTDVLKGGVLCSATIVSSNSTIEHCDFQNTTRIESLGVKIIQSNFNNCSGNIIDCSIDCSNGLLIDSSIFKDCISIQRPLVDISIYSPYSPEDFEIKNSDFINCEVKPSDGETSIIKMGGRTESSAVCLEIENCTFKECKANAMTNGDGILEKKGFLGIGDSEEYINFVRVEDCREIDCEYL